MALEGGADMAEVYQRVSRSISADAKEGRAEAVETAVSFGYGLRVIKGKRLGFSYANSRENPGDVARTAIEMASVSEEDEYLDLPEPASLTGKNVDVFDEEVSGITEQKAISLSCDVERGARELDQRVTKIRKASAGFSTSEVLITNSKGLSVRYSSTMCSGSIMAIAQDAEEGQMGWGFQAGRHLDDISFDAVGREAAQRAVSMLGARNIKPVKA
ncbi:MAG: hypothetical protein GWN86_08210, partial [Desulfobacterales bacterium]|nr:hypothetical protein [Desulfobacterales bacterium]